MRLWLWLLAAVLACTAQEPANFRVSVDLVPVTCSVTSETGQPVLDMRAEEFVLLDNGEPRAVQYLWRETDLPLTIGLIVDVSGSQLSYLNEHRKTVAQFLRQVLRPQDQAFLVAVAARVKLVTGLTNSLKDLQAGVARLDSRNESGSDLAGQCPVPAGRFCPGTLLWDGVYSSARLKTNAISGRRALVVLTDGLDAGSNHSLADAVEASQSADTVVYSIRYDTSLPVQGRFRASRSRQRRLAEIIGKKQSESATRLRRLSDETGGRAYDDPKGRAAAIFAEIEQDLRNQYVIGFTTPESARDGKFHSLEVKSKRSGLTVRARKGYLAVPQ